MQVISRPYPQDSSSTRRAVRFCGACSGGRLTRSSRSSFLEYLLSEAGLFPYVCDVCRRRTYRAHYGRLLFLSLCAAVMVGLGGYAFRLRRGSPIQQPSTARARVVEDAGEVLSNEDIAKMGRVHIPSAVMQRLIAGRSHHFQIDSGSLIQLKKDGVPDDVILTMVTATLEHPAPVSAATSLHN